jgi:hypothetical protein
MTLFRVVAVVRVCVLPARQRDARNRRLGSGRENRERFRIRNCQTWDLRRWRMRAAIGEMAGTSTDRMAGLAERGEINSRIEEKKVHSFIYIAAGRGLVLNNASRSAACAFIDSASLPAE